MKTLLLFFAVMISACASNSPSKKNYSGFMADYSNLEPVKLDSGNKVLRWIDEDFKNRNYSRLLIKPVVIFPKPATQDRVSKVELENLVDQVNKNMQKHARISGLPLTNDPGPGVLVLRSAFTSIKVKAESLSPRDIIPVRLAVRGAYLAAGQEDYEVTIVHESELIDSETGEVVAKSIRKGKTLELSNRKEQFSLKHAEKLLENWGIDMQDNFERLAGFLNNNN